MIIKYIFTSLMIIISFLNAQNLADETLRRLSNHLYGLDRSMIVQSNIVKNGKIKESQKVKISTCWPKKKKEKRLTLVEYLEPKRKIGVKIWEIIHWTKPEGMKWMTMPLTGKLKDISNKKNIKSKFDFSELYFSEEIILNYKNSILENSNNLIIESVSKNSNQKKLIFINEKNRLIDKVEIYNNKNKLIKSILCEKFDNIDNNIFVSKIIIKDNKKKHEVVINITDFLIENFTDLSIFEPKGK